jgi:hypothetical protein
MPTPEAPLFLKQAGDHFRVVRNDGGQRLGCYLILKLDQQGRPHIYQEADARWQGEGTQLARRQRRHLIARRSWQQVISAFDSST